MNWYKIHKESMPLPRVKKPSSEDFEHKYDESYFDQIHERLDHRIKNETVEPDAERILGYGGYGIAYEAGDKVIKYADDSDEDELKSAELLLEWQKNNGGAFHPCVVGVYEVSSVPDSIGITRIVLEKVTPITSKFKYVETGGSQIDFRTETEKMLNRLKLDGFGYWDSHRGNVGVRENGDYVFLDLGGLYKIR